MISARDKSTLADIERQLGYAEKSGGISPSSYRSIDRTLKTLEKKKMDTRRARAILRKLTVGGMTKSPIPASAPRKSAAPSPRGTGTFPQPKGGEVKIAAPSGPVTWEYERSENRRKPSRTPPPCAVLEFKSPIDLSKAYAILYPGQIRGGSVVDFKVHGGFLLKETTEARAPFDSYVMQGARFLHKGVVQYGFDLVSECGIMMRFGHLLELPPKFQALAERMRPAVENDSRTTDVRHFSVEVTAGELLAMKVGVPGQPGMDWGIYPAL